ncbi:hypothetical protein ACB092_08G095800 [Castanea dentata]
MANIVLLLVPLFLIFNIVSLPLPARATSSYNGSCRILNDCGGGGGSSPSQSQNCKSSGTLMCRGNSYPQYMCSPPLTSVTQSRLTLNDFSEGGDGGGPSECDENITASNGRSVTAKVVDECDSVNGCDAEHAGQPPCKNNIVDGFSAVWNALGLNQDLGNVGVTWCMA